MPQTQQSRKKKMHISNLDYNLPPERIAQFPNAKRENSKLLVFNKTTGEISHHIFKDLPDLLDEKLDIFRNKVSVIKARIIAQRESGGKCECLLLQPTQEENTWNCLLKPSKKLKIGSTFGIDGKFQAQVLEKYEDGQAKVKFISNTYQDVISLSEEVGYIPLPPYIARDINSPDYDSKLDSQRYQTVYADNSQKLAVAAPTAGLHFSDALNEELLAKGHKFHDLILRIGIGTFKPLSSEIVQEHNMHSEYYHIFEKDIALIKDKSVKKLAIGTTSLRAMEDFCRKNPITNGDYIDEASLFIYPPQEVIACDNLITNFHLPRSTLMCLVAAFIKSGDTSGLNTIKEIYKIAIDRKYNFFSYGDAMLIKS